MLIILLFFNKTQKVFAQPDTFTVDNIIIEGKMEKNNLGLNYFDPYFFKIK